MVRGSYFVLIVIIYFLLNSINTSQDGRVGLRRQFQVLVRKGMGSNPILDNLYFRIFMDFHLFFPLLFFAFLGNQIGSGKRASPILVGLRCVLFATTIADFSFHVE